MPRVIFEVIFGGVCPLAGTSAFGRLKVVDFIMGTIFVLDIKRLSILGDDDSLDKGVMD
jgi:hypothetical protein